MKKSILAVAVLLGATTTFAQDKQYTPESGDWAIGVDATPFLNYFGNFIGGVDANAAPSWNFLTNNQTITGKYFASEDMAYRGAIRLGFGSSSSSEMVADRLVSGIEVPVYPSTEPSMVENTSKSSYSAIGLAGGIEYRKGSGRLVGFYGGELGINIMTSKTVNTWGNALTQSSSATANNVDVTGAETGATDPFGNAARVLTNKSGLGFGLGVRGFIGAEYFVLPKISLAGEFGWGLGFMANGTSSVEMESEGVDGGGNEATSTFTVETNNGSSFGVDTDNMNTVFGPAGTLRLTFHF